MKKKFLILGGDQRQLSCAENLMKQGFFVSIYGFSKEHTKRLTHCRDFWKELSETDYLLLPLPVSRDGVNLNAPLWEQEMRLSELYDHLPGNIVVFGGMIQQPELLSRKNVYDYANEEDFLIKNAQITAEGAFQIVFCETPFCVYGTKILITGYGRIGKILARIAKALGADTYVAARNIRDLTWIELAGCHPLSYRELPRFLGEFQVILNTVPEPIFQSLWIDRLVPDCFFVDLASAPGGIDWEYAQNKGIRAVKALSLPGKVAPYSSGKIISDTIINLLNKE